MKPLTLLLCLLFLLGCEKRTADPELEAAREWLLSTEGQIAAAKYLSYWNLRAAAANLIDYPEAKKSIDQLVPSGNWVIKRAVHPIMDYDVFAIYAEEKMGGRGGLFFVYLSEAGFKLTFVTPVGPFITESEFEELGDPVSMEKYAVLGKTKTPTRNDSQFYTMKTPTLLLCLFLLGCEKRVADPELEKARKLILSKEGQASAAVALGELGVSCDQLCSPENWIPISWPRDSLTGGLSFPFFATFENHDDGVCIVVGEGKSEPLDVRYAFELTSEELIALSQ